MSHNNSSYRIMFNIVLYQWFLLLLSVHLKWHICPYRWDGYLISYILLDACLFIFSSLAVEFVIPTLYPKVIFWFNFSCSWSLLLLFSWLRRVKRQHALWTMYWERHVKFSITRTSLCFLTGFLLWVSKYYNLSPLCVSDIYLFLVWGGVGVGAVCIK